MVTTTNCCHQGNQKMMASFCTYTRASGMGISKTLEAYGELDITRANNFLNLKILKHNTKGINQ
jgi:hypothetical protein